MSITNASILVDGTVAITAGTATTVLSKGGTLNQLKTYLDGASSYLAQTVMNWTVSDPVVNSGQPNGYTQKRSICKIIEPLALDNGNTTHNTLEIKLSVDPETTDAEIDSMIVMGVNALADSEFVEFWRAQSLS